MAERSAKSNLFNAVTEETYVSALKKFGNTCTEFLQIIFCKPKSETFRRDAPCLTSQYRFYIAFKIFRFKSENRYVCLHKCDLLIARILVACNLNPIQRFQREQSHQSIIIS